jgi:hypothetical protein
MEITEAVGMVVHKLPAVCSVGSSGPVIALQNDDALAQQTGPFAMNVLP